MAIFTKPTKTKQYWVTVFFTKFPQSGKKVRNKHWNSCKSLIKYGFHCADIYKTHNYSIKFSGRHSTKFYLSELDDKSTKREKTFIFALTTLTISHGIVWKHPIWDNIHILLEIRKVRVEINFRHQVKSDSHWTYNHETHACALKVL
jgi:hypothetical protein